MELQGMPARQMFFFPACNGYSSATLRTFFVQEMLHRGILSAGHLLTSYAHTQDDVKQTLDACEEVFAMMQEGIESKTLEKMIDIPVHQLFLGEDVNT